MFSFTKDEKKIHIQINILRRRMDFPKQPADSQTQPLPAIPPKGLTDFPTLPPGIIPRARTAI